jgi:hypothetical protein
MITLTPWLGEGNEQKSARLLLSDAERTREALLAPGLLWSTPGLWGPDDSRATAKYGVFYAGAWLAVLVGVLWLWRRSWRAAVNGRWTALVAAMVAGWGSFNVVEGLVDHYLLNLHHLRPGPNQAAYDIAFLILGVLLALGGFAWYKRTTASARAPAPQSRLHGDRGQSSLAEKHRLSTGRCLE